MSTDNRVQHIVFLLPTLKKVARQAALDKGLSLSRYIEDALIQTVTADGYWKDSKPTNKLRE